MIPLALHSHFSLLYSPLSPAALCETARRLGYTTIGLTDINNLYGLWEFLEQCDRHGLRPIIGAELRHGHERVFCLVKNRQGYGVLCGLLSARLGERDFSLHGMQRESLQGMVLLTPVPALLRRWRELELDVCAALLNRPDQQGSELYGLAGRLGIAAVAVADVFSAPDRTREHALLRAIAARTTLSSPGGQAAKPECLVSPAEYGQRFAVWPGVVRMSREIAERCTFRRPAFGLVLPRFHNLSDDQAAYRLRRLAFAGAAVRYGRPLPEVVLSRLEHELRVIAEMKFSGYFLVVREIVRPVSRTCGRGSGAASLVAYCLRITNVCPIRHNLYFERFLNPGRTDAPDIDIDFAWDEREQVLRSVFQRYSGHCAMVCNHVRLQPRRALREVAAVHGLPAGEISRVSRHLSGMRGRSLRETLAEKLEGLPIYRRLLEAPWPEIIRYADRLTGVPRNLSLHPGGIIITPEPITNYVPVEPAARGIPMVQWDKDGVEDAGLVKIDLLGNRSLGVIRDAAAAAEKNGASLPRRHHPEEDPATRELIRQGNTMGCFYIESPAMRQLQKRAARGDFEHLVIHSSIIRPAANNCIREYLRRLHGGAWQPLHPLLEEPLRESYGILVFQEDVSRVAVRLGFSPEEADRLRKIMSKKDRYQQLADYRQRLFTTAASRGMDRESIEKLWEMMMSFAGYSFCKPHSASYARVSFQAAFLKAHYPAEFMAAVLSNRGGYYTPFAYVSESRRMGLQVLPPDILKSDWHWSGAGSRLRVGLMAVRGLSGQTARRIVRLRKERGTFSSMEEFFCLVRPDEDEARALIHAGALDCLSLKQNSRPALLYRLACHCRMRARAGEMLFPPRITPPSLPPEDPRERLRNEYRILGFLCRSHPIVFFDPWRRKHRTCPARKINEENSRLTGRTIRFLGWPITGKIVSTSRGESMEFMSFEDETGQVECTFFPRVWKKYRHLLHAGAPLLLEGVVETEFKVSTLTVHHARRVRA